MSETETKVVETKNTERLKHARKHLVAVKESLEKRIALLESRKESLEAARNETLDQDNDEGVLDRMNRVDEVEGRLDEIADLLSQRLEAIEGLVGQIEDEIDTLRHEAKQRAKETEPPKPKVLKYMIRKRNRPTDTLPYNGNSCARANLKGGLYYDTKDAAQVDADKLNAVNSKGFDVVEVWR